jgi:gas vesicle protein
MNKIMFALLAGVVVGLLIAPDKGSETVKKLRSRLSDYKDQASDELEGLATKGKKAFEQGRNKVKDVID